MAHTRFRTVFLDAGGVLVTPNWLRASATLARQGVTVTPDALAAAEPFVKRQLDIAPVLQSTNDHQRAHEFFDRILERTGIPVTEATNAAMEELAGFNDHEGVWDVVTPGAVEALQRLRAAQCRLVVVSNSNKRVRRILRRVGLEPYVDLVIDSQEEGVEKPDPRIFDIALERSEADRGSTIHCGDIYHIDVIGARAAGLSAVLLDAAGVYADVDCPRVASLPEFVDALLLGTFD